MAKGKIYKYVDAGLIVCTTPHGILGNVFDYHSVTPPCLNTVSSSVLAEKLTSGRHNCGITNSFSHFQILG